MTVYYLTPLFLLIEETSETPFLDFFVPNLAELADDRLYLNVRGHFWIYFRLYINVRGHIRNYFRLILNIRGHFWSYFRLYLNFRVTFSELGALGELDRASIELYFDFSSF